MGDDENFGSMLSESDGFDKLINQLKKEKIEDDRNYEKQKLREKEKEKKKLKEDDYDINNLVDNFNNVNIDNFKKKETDNNIFDDGIFDDKDFNFSKNKEQSPNSKSKQNRRGNARHFLEETENNGEFNFNGPKKSSNDNEFGNFNLGGSGEIGSLFGNKSRRKQHDKNYEI